MRIQLTLAVVVLLACAGRGTCAEISELNFSVGPNEMLWSKADFGPLAEDLAKAISLPVKLCEARSHADAVEALRSSQIQLGWFCNRSAVAAIDSANGEIFAEIDGSHGDKTSIVVHQDGPIAKDLDRILAQSKASGKPMRFPSWLAGLEPLFDHAKEITFLQDQPLSTAAFLSSHFFFTENGIDPQTAFKKYGVGTLQSNALAVADGTADAAVFKYGALDIFARRYPAKGAQLRVICRGPGGGNDPLVWRADLPNDLKNKIRNFFLDYAKSEANRSKLAALKWKGFLPASNRHVNPYRYLLALTEKAELEKDGQIPAADKQVRLAELTQRIQELKTLGGWHIPHRKPIDYSKPLDSQLNPSPQTPATSAK